MQKILISSMLVGMLFLLPSCGGSEASNSSTQPKEGEIASTFTAVDTSVSTNSISTELPKTEEDILREEGWEHSSVSNGVMPACYNYVPTRGELENELTVTVGGGTDVAVKVMSLNSGRCVRYVFINSGSTYSVRNIQEDRYYLKIAYGKDWISKTENGQCLGRFLSNALYEKGEEVMDFNRQSTMDGYSIPSYSLRLDVVSGSSENTFSSSGISEGEFNN